MISEEEAEKAVEYLRDSAREHAQNRANRIYMEEFRKVIKSQIIIEIRREKQGKGEKISDATAEAMAYSDERYTKHLKAMETAIEKDENGRFMRSAAEARFEAWRTQEATRRTGP